VKMKIKQLGYIVARPAKTGDTHFFWADCPNDPSDIIVTMHTIEFEVPDNVGFTRERVKDLCLQRAEIQRKFDASMEDINQQIVAVMGVTKESEL